MKVDFSLKSDLVVEYDDILAAKPLADVLIRLAVIVSLAKLELDCQLLGSF